MDGCVAVPKKPGLGIEVDMEQVMKAHQLYLRQLPGRQGRLRGHAVPDPRMEVRSQETLPGEIRR